MVTKLTRHAQIERIDRISEILAHMALGEPCITRQVLDEQNRYAKEVLTDTGIIIIYNAMDAVVTLMLATVDRAIAMGNGNIPYSLLRTIQRNERKYAYIYKIST